MPLLFNLDISFLPIIYAFFACKFIVLLLCVLSFSSVIDNLIFVYVILVFASRPLQLAVFAWWQLVFLIGLHNFKLHIMCNWLFKRQPRVILFHELMRLVLILSVPLRTIMIIVETVERVRIERNESIGEERLILMSI